MVASESEFEQLHGDIAERARKLAVDRDGVHTTVLLGKGSTLTLVGIPSIPGIEVADQVRPVAQASGADYLFFISEAWLSLDPTRRPSEHPDRKEVLIVSAEHLQYGARMLQFELIRNARNKVVTTTPVVLDYDQVGGRLAGLLTGGEGTGESVGRHRHPGYKRHFKMSGYVLH